VVRGRVELPTFRFSGGRSYRLSYLTLAVLTGFEPATSTLTGWRALRAALQDLVSPTTGDGAPNGIRTRAAALKGRCPRPLDDGGSNELWPAVTLAPAVGNGLSIGEKGGQQQSASDKHSPLALR
jgi:hypothetical protein